jgi:protein-disulfide isomerase
LESDEGDLTRKQRREQAREERKAAEQAAAAGDARRKRMTQLGGAVAVVVVAIVVILVATGSGGGKKTPTLVNEKGGGQSTEVKKAVAEVKQEIDGIPQSGNVLGSPAAPVTLQYFGDLECPICREFTTGALPALIQKWVKTGKLRVEYRNLETATREPEVFTTQQTDALAAGKQNKGWYFIELFYHLQGEEDSGYVTEKYLQGLASATPGLNLAKWSSDRSDQTLQAKIATDTQEANNNGFTGTPSFLIGKSGGALKKFEYSSLTDPSSFNEAIEKLLKA